jgi:hypothetical protein
MLITVYDNDQVICQLDDELPVLKHKWKGPIPGEDFRQNLLRIAEHYRQLSASYANLAWLADTRLLGEVDEETEQWFAEVWDKLLFEELGVKYHAVVLGEDLFAEYPMEKFKLRAAEKFKTHGVQLEVFSDEEEAYAWIRTR